jgi:gliding motility associated protien GldN
MKTAKMKMGVLGFIFSLLFSSVIGQNVLEPMPRIEQDHVRYEDLMWAKRIWRRIDLRQKLNHPLYFPESPANGRVSLFESMKTAVLSGNLSAYYPGPLGLDDMFSNKYKLDELDSILNPIQQVMLIDPSTQKDTIVMFRDPIETQDVLIYELKEDWYFDKERYVMEVRIVGICPMILVLDEETGDFRGYKKLFWIPFIELRNEMNNWPIYTRNNALEAMSFDDLFEKRMFQSLIVKESNVYDRYIMQYASGKDAILESDRINQDVLEFEHDLWSY